MLEDRAMRALWLLVVGCGWSGYGPGPTPGKWKSCGPYCMQPVGAPEPDCIARGTLEFATWVAPDFGTRLTPDHELALGLSVGTEATVPVAFDEALRVGPWLELGADSLDLVHARGGLVVSLGALHDPGLIPGHLAATSGEGALSVRLGAGWRAIGLIDSASDRGQLSVRLTYGSRAATEVYESGNAYGVCDGSEHTTRDGHRLDLGHFGPGFAFGHRLFVELERSVDAPTMQLIFGVELDPVTMWMSRREANVRLL
jgi:hypothetical protein